MSNRGNTTAEGLLSYSVYARPEGAPESERALLTAASKFVRIRADGHVRLTSRFTLPANLPPGSYELSVVVDVDAAFGEADEGNNTLTALVPLVVS